MSNTNEETTKNNLDINLEGLAIINEAFYEMVISWNEIVSQCREIGFMIDKSYDASSLRRSLQDLPNEISFAFVKKINDSRTEVD